MAAASSSPTNAGGESLKEKKHAKQQWLKILKDALDADSWGQSIEATEQYEKLHRVLEMQIPELQLTPEEKSVCMKVAHSVALRMHTLGAQEALMNDNAGSSASQSAQKLTLDEVKALQPVLDDLFVRQASAHFPIALKDYTATLPTKKPADQHGAGEVFIAHDDRLEKEERGSLLLPPKVKAGLTTLSLTLEKIGLKDAQTYINSYITVSVAAPNGQMIESQDTPKSNSLKPTYVLFANTTVHIQTTYEEIIAKNLCIFLEFKHYKPAKKKTSTRCFALIEAKELEKMHQQGSSSSAVCLELYKKPTDFSRRTSLSLFTIKQLYMHLAVTFTKH